MFACREERPNGRAAPQEPAHACQELVDLRRAHEWTVATRRWCAPLPLTSLYPGICRVHWAEVLQLRGSWAEAEAEEVTA